MNKSLSKFQEIVKDGEAWPLQSQGYKERHNLATEQQQCLEKYSSWHTGAGIQWTGKKSYCLEEGEELGDGRAGRPHSSTLAWKIPWMEEPGRLQSMGSQRVGHDWVMSCHVRAGRAEGLLATGDGGQGAISLTLDIDGSTSCVNIWKFPTWRFICRGLSVYHLFIVFWCECWISPHEGKIRLG